MKTRAAWLSGTAAIVLVAAAAALRSAEGDSPTDRDRIPTAARKEIKSVELEIDRIEAESLNRARSATLDRFQQITLLGKLIFYDRELSVRRNESCSFCHMPDTGFSGPVSALNQTTVAYPGSVRTRFSGRKPQSHTYASFSYACYRTAPGQFARRAGTRSSIEPGRDGPHRPGMHGVSNVPAALSCYGGKALGCAIIRGSLAGEHTGSVRSSRPGAACGPLTASPRGCREGNRSKYL